MALEYVMANFLTGTITARNLPVNKGTDKNEISLQETNLEIEINVDALPAGARNGWKNYFKPLARMVALVDNSLPWNHPDAVLACGFVDVVNAPAGKGFIRLQMSDVNEWLAQVAAVRQWAEAIIDEPLEEGEEDPAYSAATWRQLLGNVLSKPFEASPAGAPQPPSIIVGSFPTGGAGDKQVPDIFDGTTYKSLAEQIRDEESGIGIEWRFKPVFRDVDTLGFTPILGTDDVPHINSNLTETISLSETSSEKISSFSTAIDSRDVFNKVYLKHGQLPPTEEGEEPPQRLVAKWQNTDPELPLVSKFVTNTNQMTPEQATALQSAYLQDGTTGGTEISFSVEENWDKAHWVNNLGKMITFTGVPDSISAGHTVTVRCVSVEFSVQQGTIKVTFMPPASKYPVLPKQKKMKDAFKPAEKVGWTQYGKKGFTRKPWEPGYGTGVPTPPDGGGDGGGTTPPPTTDLPDTGGDWVSDGVFNPDDLWGSEGRDPFDTTPRDKDFTAFEDKKEIDYDFAEWDGASIMDPETIFAHEGNRIYSLSELAIGYGTVVIDGNTTHIQGGMDIASGRPLVMPEDIYVKKTNLNKDGTIGKVETAGVFPMSQIMAECLPDFVDNSGNYKPPYNQNEIGEVYRGGIHFTAWYVNNRIYIGIGYKIWTGTRNDFQVGNRNFYSDTHNYFSIAVNGRTGLTEGPWKYENLIFLNRSMSHPKYIHRYGKVVIFGHGTHLYEGQILNISYSDWTKSQPDPSLKGYPNIEPMGGLPPIAAGMPVADADGNLLNGSIDFTFQSMSLHPGHTVKDFANASENVPKPFRSLNRNNSVGVTTTHKWGTTIRDAALLNGFLIADSEENTRIRYMQLFPTYIEPNQIWEEVPSAATTSTGWGSQYAVSSGNVFVRTEDKAWIFKMNTDGPVSGSTKEITVAEHAKFGWSKRSTTDGIFSVKEYLRLSSQYPDWLFRQSRFLSYGERIFCIKLMPNEDGSQRLRVQSMKFKL